MTNNEFQKWEREILKRYRSEKRDKGCGVMAYNHVVVCIDSDRKIGIAKCHPNDVYNLNIGTAIAYARCKGIEVSKVTNHKRLSEMENGDIFKIKISGYNYRYIGKDEFNRYVCRNMTTNRYDAFYDNGEYEMVD